MTWLDIVKFLFVCSTAFLAVFMLGWFFGWKRGYSESCRRYRKSIEELTDQAK